MKITADGTALITVYDIISIDLSPLGSRAKRGWVWDCLIQEVDIETGELVFEWRVSDHVKVQDTYRNIGGEGGIRSRPFDYFHMNSVEKDPLGNYLISSRYFHTLTYIDGRTKEILWTLGGKNNSFKDLSDGQATSFSWQHHARWHDNYTTITIFDNGAQNGQITAPYSRGVHIKLDTTSNPMTAELIQEYFGKDRLSSESQGSFQLLENGNTVMGYGHNPLMSEFAADGTILCEAYFGSQSRINTGDIQSYRVFKHEWVGRPLDNPVVKILTEEVGGGLLVSWMGATEVRYWSIELSLDAEATKYSEVSRTRKSGFETTLQLGRAAGFLRVVALDKDGRTLGWSDVIDLSIERVYFPNFSSFHRIGARYLRMHTNFSIQTWATTKLNLVNEGSAPLVIFIGMIAFFCTLYIVYEFVQWRLKVRQQSNSDDKEKENNTSEEAERFLDQNSSEDSPNPSPRQPIPKIYVEETSDRNWN